MQGYIQNVRQGAGRSLGKQRESVSTMPSDPKVFIVLGSSVERFGDAKSILKMTIDRSTLAKQRLRIINDSTSIAHWATSFG
jgi:hypothetical protein